MLIARVIGEIVATQKDEHHRGHKAMVVQPVNLDGSDRGSAIIALDSVDAGIGDRVLVAIDGYAAATAVGKPRSSIDAAILGIIDSVDLCPPDAASR